MDKLIVVAKTNVSDQEYFIVDEDDPAVKEHIFPAHTGEGPVYARVSPAIEVRILEDWKGDKRFDYQRPVFGWYLAKVSIS